MGANASSRTNLVVGFLKIAFGRPLLSEPHFAGRTTVARSEEYSICKMGGSFVGAATPEGLSPSGKFFKYTHCGNLWPQP